MSNLASASSHQTTADVESVNNRPKVSGADTAPNLAALQPAEILDVDVERSAALDVLYTINFTVEMVVVVAIPVASAIQQVDAVAVDFMTVAAVVAAVDFMVVMTAASLDICLLYTSPSPRDLSTSRMPSSA